MRRMRPCLSSYLILPLIAGGVLMAIIVSGIFKRGWNDEWLKMLLIVIGGNLLWLWYIWCFDITLDASTLTYRSLPGRRIAIRLEDITRVEFKIGQRNKPLYCISVYEKHRRTPALMINAKPFSREAIKFLMTTLTQKCGNKAGHKG